MMLNIHIQVSPHDACWTLATFLYSLALVLGHCISHQLTGTIAAPGDNEKNKNIIYYLVVQAFEDLKKDIS